MKSIGLNRLNSKKSSNIFYLYVLANRISGPIKSFKTDQNTKQSLHYQAKCRPMGQLLYSTHPLLLLVFSSINNYSLRCWNLWEILKRKAIETATYTLNLGYMAITVFSCNALKAATWQFRVRLSYKLVSHSIF